MPTMQLQPAHHPDPEYLCTVTVTHVGHTLTFDSNQPYFPTLAYTDQTMGDLDLEDVVSLARQLAKTYMCNLPVEPGAVEVNLEHQFVPCDACGETAHIDDLKPMGMGLGCFDCRRPR